MIAAIMFLVELTRKVGVHVDRLAGGGAGWMLCVIPESFFDILNKENVEFCNKQVVSNTGIYTSTGHLLHHSSPITGHGKVTMS